MSTRRSKNLLRDERGETMVSYALLVVLIALICIPATRGISHGFGRSACQIEMEGSIDHPGGSNYDGQHCFNDADPGRQWPGTFIW